MSPGALVPPMPQQSWYLFLDLEEGRLYWPPTFPLVAVGLGPGAGDLQPSLLNSSPCQTFLQFSIDRQGEEF